MRRQSRQSGFTLLELLVALAMMAALATSLYASLGVAFRGRDRSMALLDPVRASAATMDLFRADIESAMLPTGILAGAFTGADAKSDSGKDADTLVFHNCAHNPDESQTASDVQQVEYALVQEPNESEGVLVRQITTNLLAPELPTPVEETLCRHVLSFNMQYFDGAAWQDTWDATSQGTVLPMAVQVTLEVTPAPTNQPAMLDTVGYKTARIFMLTCGRATAVDETAAAGSAPTP